MIAAGKEDLGLSLSLTSFSGNHRGLSLKPSSISPPSHGHQKLPWFDAFSPFDHRSTGPCHGGYPPVLGRIDVNRPPHTAGPDDDEEEEAGVSSPNSTVSSVSGKRSERELDPASAADEHETERASSRGISDEEDGDNSRKKLRLSKDQSAVLEESFREHNTLNPKQKLALAKRLGLRPRQVEVWFQNRRARTKLKQTEIDCELLKRCCENLTEENRRLQKEVQELRALRLPPQFFVPPMAPPTTLTMCPSCERIAVPPATSLRPGNASSMAVKPWAWSPAPIVHSVFRPCS